MAKTALTLVEATEAWIKAEKERGCLTEVWATTDTTGGVAIVEVESNDALYLKLEEVPFMPFMQFCVTPLTDMKLSIEAGKKSYKKMAGE